MAKGDLARSGRGATAQQGTTRNTVMGAAKGALQHDAICLGQHAHNTIDFCYLQGFTFCHGRQNGHQAAGQHGFATARATNHHNAVATGSGNFQGPASHQLSLNIRKIHVVKALLIL